MNHITLLVLNLVFSRILVIIIIIIIILFVDILFRLVLFIIVLMIHSIHLIESNDTILVVDDIK